MTLTICEKIKWPVILIIKYLELLAWQMSPIVASGEDQIEQWWWPSKQLHSHAKMLSILYFNLKKCFMQVYLNIFAGRQEYLQGIGFMLKSCSIKLTSFCMLVHSGCRYAPRAAAPNLGAAIIKVCRESILAVGMSDESFSRRRGKQNYKKKRWLSHLKSANTSANFGVDAKQLLRLCIRCSLERAVGSSGG